MDFKKWLQKLINNENGKNSSDKKNIGSLLILFLVGVLIVLTVSFYNTSNSPSIQTLSPNVENKKNNNNNKIDQTSSTDKNLEDYETVLQDKLKNTLEQIDGVGKVQVMVSFETGEEQIPAVNINDSTSTTEEKDNEGGTRSTTQKNNGSTVVITNDGDKSEPLIVKKYKPRVAGVVVVAEGAENKVTEIRISRAVINLFNIPENKVTVYPMKK